MHMMHKRLLHYPQFFSYDSDDENKHGNFLFTAEHHHNFNQLKNKILRMTL